MVRPYPNTDYTRSKPRGTVGQRCLAKIDRPPDPDACQLFMGSKDRFGYGQVNDGKRPLKAHRIVWELTYGPIPEGMQVLHNCPDGDNPSCCNPRHLWLGTQLENIEDARKKGRVASGERHSSRTHPEQLPRGDKNGSRLHPERLARGERHGIAKLTEASVREIRALAGTQSQRALAARFGVSQATISGIVHRTKWSHVE